MNDLLLKRKSSVYRFLLIQTLFACVLSVIVLFAKDTVTAYSFLLGTLSSIVPSLYLALKVFRKTGAQAAQEIVRSFYRGEAGKLAMTAVFLTLVFLLVKPLAAGSFFAGFGLAIISHWLSPLVIRH